MRRHRNSNNLHLRRTASEAAGGNNRHTLLLPVLLTTAALVNTALVIITDQWPAAALGVFAGTELALFAFPSSHSEVASAAIIAGSFICQVVPSPYTVMIVSLSVCCGTLGFTAIRAHHRVAEDTCSAVEASRTFF